ncbi:uncharacterized protein LOC112087241 [Eutrema salsugineum]|uniref:uncharacterized protein LOC112087241 n=1 Tax=Eutrema salsugineum TaxID=72664 RepID=UPI000CED3869|nr:uncharacterized protein LOC112087241 [Eutrema salsugineum]
MKVSMILGSLAVCKSSLDTAKRPNRKSEPTLGELDTSQGKRLLQLHELEEIRLDALESSRIYKERTKTLHDQKILKRKFKEGDLVLLFNSRLKLFPGKLRSRWSGQFRVLEVRSYGALVLEGKDGKGFVVNGLRIKHYLVSEKREEASTVSLDDPPTC